MARKEEEKKKESSKLAVLKVLNVSDRCCFPLVTKSRKMLKTKSWPNFLKRIPLLICPFIPVPSERLSEGTLEKAYFVCKLTGLACCFWLLMSTSSLADKNCPIYNPISPSLASYVCSFLFPKVVNTATLKSLLVSSLRASIVYWRFLVRSVCILVLYKFQEKRRIAINNAQRQWEVSRVKERSAHYCNEFYMYDPTSHKLWHEILK